MTTLAEDYLDGNEGSSRTYRDKLTQGERIGQAFVNSLSRKDYGRLTGSIWDPFYKNDNESIHVAIDKLLFGPI